MVPHARSSASPTPPHHHPNPSRSNPPRSTPSQPHLHSASLRLAPPHPAAAHPRPPHHQPTPSSSKHRPFLFFQVWYRLLSGGQVAVGLYNKGGKSPPPIPPPPCEKWNVTTRGYYDASGGASGNLGTFSGLSVGQAQSACCANLRWEISGDITSTFCTASTHPPVVFHIPTVSPSHLSTPSGYVCC